MRLAARYDSDAAHTITSSIRRYAAVDTESPTPVPIATYAARHAGHFGKSARTVPETIHPAMSRRRRASVGAWAATCDAVRAAFVSQSVPIEVASQQR